MEHSGIIEKMKNMGGFRKNAKYIVAVTKEVKEQAGNKMVSDETWSLLPRQYESEYILDFVFKALIY